MKLFSYSSAWPHTEWMPKEGKCSCTRNCSHTPRLTRGDWMRGGSVSPMRGLPYADFSMMTTEYPRRVSASAVEAPAGPPPNTVTSTLWLAFRLHISGTLLNDKTQPVPPFEHT